MDGYPGAVGVKTGYTSKAGRTFIGAAERDGRTLIVALMGIREPSDEAARKLLNWGFANRDEIIPVGELVGPASDQVASASALASPEATSPTGPILVSDVATSQEPPTLSSLSPTAWGWLTIFSAVIAVALVAVIRRVFTRRRRRIAN